MCIIKGMLKRGRVLHSEWTKSRDRKTFVNNHLVIQRTPKACEIYTWQLLNLIQGKTSSIQLQNYIGNDTFHSKLIIKSYYVYFYLENI